MPVETLTHEYTSRAEVERLLSQVGVNLRVTDLTGDNLTSYWTELVADATDTINQYVLLFYDAADLADNRWVRGRATWIAMTRLCRRKANPVPDGISERYEEIIEELKMVQQGKMLIPRLATSVDMLPSMSNQRVDDRFHVRKLRTNPTISVGNVSGDQDLDWLWTYDWF